MLLEFSERDPPRRVRKYHAWASGTPRNRLHGSFLDQRMLKKCIVADEGLYQQQGAGNGYGDEPLNAGAMSDYATDQGDKLGNGFGNAECFRANCWKRAEAFSPIVGTGEMMTMITSARASQHSRKVASMSDFQASRQHL